MLGTYLPRSIYAMGAQNCDFTCGALRVRADIVFIWLLSARLVKLYVLSAQHVKCGVLRDEHVQIWHSSIIQTLQFYTENRYNLYNLSLAKI